MLTFTYHLKSIWNRLEALAVAESKRGMTQDKVKLTSQGACPEKWTSSSEERLCSLPEDGLAAAEYRTGMTQ